ncbi:MAG TPA: hypothetical protein VFD80_04605 [Flavobacteriaceae bacterium]|nr:hypothetical protein [Flavobacteriaceae bacterium]
MKERAKKYEEELLKVIKEKKIAFFDHCFGFTSFSRRTAYDYKLHELHSIKGAIAKNRATSKNYMLNKWIDSDNATLQISAMRLLSDPEEHKLLNQSYIRSEDEVKDISVNVNIIKPDED